MYYVIIMHPTHPSLLVFLLSPSPHQHPNLMSSIVYFFYFIPLKITEDSLLQKLGMATHAKKEVETRERKEEERKEKILVAHSKEHHLGPGTEHQCGIVFVLLMSVLEGELCGSSLRTTSPPEKAPETEPRTTGS